MSADEDFTPPTAQALREAVAQAYALGANEEPRPTGVVQDGDGGLVIEWRSGQKHIMYAITGEGRVFRSEFDGETLIDAGPRISRAAPASAKDGE